MILKAIARGKIRRGKSAQIIAGTVLSAAAIWVATGSVPIAVCACATCAGLILWARIGHDAWREWQGRRALDQAVAVANSGKPERAWMTMAERDAWLGIILKSYTNEELDAYTRRGEQLRVNRGRR